MTQQMKAEIKQIGLKSRRSMLWLRENNLPADPICYAVAFELHNNPDQAFVDDINKLSDNYAENIGIVYQVFKDYIGTEQPISNKEVVQKLAGLMQKTLSTVTHSKDALAGYSGTLSGIENIKDLSSDQAKASLDILVEETLKMQQKTQQLEEQLNDANHQISALQSRFQSVQQEALQDPLTQLLNRAGLEKAINERVNDNGQGSSSVIIADIDHFKAFNDIYGHLVGDKVLQQVAHLLKCISNKNATVARFGGEEFIVLLNDFNIEQLQQTAENIRSTIANKPLEVEGHTEALGPITVSIGTAEFKHQTPFKKALELADKALYQAKSNGRNCVKHS